MERGEVWWANLAPPIGRRPVLLISRDTAIKVRSSITVIPITKTIRNIPAEVLLEASDGLPVRCVANADNIQTVEKHQIQSRLATLSSGRMLEVAKAIRFALALES